MPSRKSGEGAGKTLIVG